MSDRPAKEDEILHELKNHLATILGFCELLLDDVSQDDPRHADLLDVDKAARAGAGPGDRQTHALSTVPERKA